MGNGWLVIHAFRDSRSNGDRYVAAIFLESGSNLNVESKVDNGLTTREMSKVMLHHDSNDSGILNFVFVDDHHVNNAINPKRSTGSSIAHAESRSR